MIKSIFDKFTFDKFTYGTITDYLKTNYPGEWKFNNKTKVWEDKKNGRHVWRCAVLSPRYDGDDDTFSTEYWMYSDDGSIPIKIF